MTGRHKMFLSATAEEKRGRTGKGQGDIIIDFPVRGETRVGEFMSSISWEKQHKGVWKGEGNRRGHDRNSKRVDAAGGIKTRNPLTDPKS